MTHQVRTRWLSSLTLRRTLLLLAAFGVWVLISRSCKRWILTHDRQAQAKAATPFLEAANAERRRVGLWPITPSLADRSYDGDSVAHLRIKMDKSKQRFRPYIESKDMVYSVDNNRLVMEVEGIALTPAYSFTGRCPEYILNRKYVYADAAQGRNPWSITLDDYCGEGKTQLPLTLAEADSVLTYWWAQAERDSLAAVSSGPQPL